MLLIVLEGIDCCGKTTASKILEKALNPSIRISFPDRTTQIGKLLDSFLKKEIKLSPIEAHLLYSANRYEKANFIRETLKHSHIICDRYWLSGAVYSAAKGLDFDWCKSVDKDLPIPDLTFFIDVDPEITTKRKVFGEEAHDQVDFQKKVYEIYNSQRDNVKNMIFIDGKHDPEAITKEILTKIKSKI